MFGNAEKSLNMRLLTVRETAERARVSEATVYRWLATKTLRGFKPRKSWLVREDDLEEFLTRPPAGWSLEQYVSLIVDGAPLLTEDQLARLREAFGRRDA